MRFAIVKCCSADAHDAIPQGIVNVRISEALASLSAKGWRVVADAGTLCVVERDGVEATLYSSGRVLVKSSDAATAERAALAIYEDAGIQTPGP
jgi:hypothetical protein